MKASRGCLISTDFHQALHKEDTDQRIQVSDLLVTLVWNPIDHAVEKHGLNAVDNDLECGLLSVRH